MVDIELHFEAYPMPVHTPMGTLTVSQLIDLMSDRTAVRTNIRLSVAEYAIRKAVIDKKLANTLDILQANYWELLTKYIQSLPRVVNPVRIITGLKKLNINEPEHKKLSEHLIDLRALLHNLQLITINVENSICYDEAVYD